VAYHVDLKSDSGKDEDGGDEEVAIGGGSRVLDGSAAAIADAAVAAAAGADGENLRASGEVRWDGVDQPQRCRSSA
jgi:hypothetical protein